MHLFQNKMNESRSIKVLSIAAYFFPCLKQFSNSILKKWLVFGGDPILEPIFHFVKEVNRWLGASFGTTSNQKEQHPENTATAVKHPIWVFSNFFTTLVTWGQALSWKRITLSLLVFRPFFSQWLKRINYSWYQSPVTESPGFSSS